MFSLNVPVKYSNTVYDTFRPIYIVSRLYGYLHFSATITKPSSNKIYLTKVDHFIFITHVVAYILCTALNFNIDIHETLSSSELLAKGVRIQLICGCILCCIMVVIELVFKTSFWNIIESLNEFDLKFQTLDRVINHSKHKKLLKRYMVLCCLIYFIFSMYSFVINFESSKLITTSSFMLSYSLINGLFGTASSLYSFLIYSIKVRFEALNDCLRDEGHYLRSLKYVEYINKESSCDKIVKIAQLYDKLTDTIGLVNRRFSIQILILIATAFVFSIFTLYSLYRVYSTCLFNLDEFKGATLHAIWTLYYNIFILTIIWLGSSVRSEGAYTGVLIHKIINDCTNKQIAEKLILFSQQLQHQGPIATCKLFTLDWTLLFTIIGATTTYLTILIQFDSPLNGNRNTPNETSIVESS